MELFQCSGPAELPEAVLSNGVRVRLRPATPAGGAFSVVTLETWRDAETAPADSRAEPELRGVLEWLDEGVILFDAQDNVQDGEPRSLIPGLGAAVNALAEYAPIVVMGDASWEPGLQDLIAAGEADYVPRSEGCIAIAAGCWSAAWRRASRPPDHIPIYRKSGKKISPKICGTN